MGLPSLARADENARFTVYGAGASPCASWLSARQNLFRDGNSFALAWEQMGWVLGYLTAYSQHAPAGEGSPAGSTVSAELDAYCAEHPGDLLATAVSQIVTAVSKRRFRLRAQSRCIAGFRRG